MMKKSVYKGVEVETIDATPSWQNVLTPLLAVLQDGSEDGKRLASEQLKSMALVADKLVELYKSEVMQKSLAAFNSLPNTTFHYEGAQIDTYQLASQLTIFIQSVNL